MNKETQKKIIVNTILDYAEGNYHLDITEDNLNIAADKIVNLLNGNTVKLVKSCVNCSSGNVDSFKEPCRSCNINYDNWQLE